MGSQEGAEQAGSGALPLLCLRVSQGERGETGPPGPAGFAGPPVSAPATPHTQPPRAPAGEGGPELSEERNGRFPPLLARPHPCWNNPMVP